VARNDGLLGLLEIRTGDRPVRTMVDAQGIEPWTSPV
jgi:hypothetical protein